MMTIKDLSYIEGRPSRTDSDPRYGMNKRKEIHRVGESCPRTVGAITL